MLDPFELDRFKGENRVREKIVNNAPILEQIMPVVGWFAIMRHPTEGRRVIPLVCWGLYKLPTGAKTVVGLFNQGRKVVPVGAAEGIMFEGYTNNPVLETVDEPEVDLV